MKELTKWLQTNPFIVLAMFVISMTSGIAGLVLGWRQLYQDYLSKSIEIPVWLALIGLLLLPGLTIMFRSLSGRRTGKELERIEGKQFGVEQVVLDGKNFERCEFHGTEVVFEGLDSFSLQHCSFHSPRFSFSKYAANTIAVLTKMYEDGAFRPLVENTLQNIRAGTIPRAVPTSVQR